MVACARCLSRYLRNSDRRFCVEELLGDLIVRFLERQDRVAGSRFELQELEPFGVTQHLADIADLHLAKQLAQRRCESASFIGPIRPPLARDGA